MWHRRHWLVPVGLLVLALVFLGATAGWPLEGRDVAGWYAWQIVATHWLHLIRGYPDGLIHPAQSATRGEVAAVAWRLVLLQAAGLVWVLGLGWALALDWFDRHANQPQQPIAGGANGNGGGVAHAHIFLPNGEEWAGDLHRNN